MKDLNKLRKNIISLTHKCYWIRDVLGHLLHVDLYAAKAKYSAEIRKTKE